MSKYQEIRKELSQTDQARQVRLSVLAKAPAARLTTLWHGWCDHAGEPAHEVLRPPAIGTVMVRGRAGAVGAPFNLGEITVTRCSVRLPSGHVGHGYVQGRDRQASLAAALVDALAQAGHAETMDEAIIEPLALEAGAHLAARAAKAAATKVDFFTMVRGDN